MLTIPVREWPILLFSLAACSGGGATCLAEPCPIPLAISLTISSAAAGVATPAATVEVTEGGQLVTRFSCSATCPIMGQAATFDITVSAPGFTSVHQSIQVQGDSSPCKCPTTVIQHVTIALTPSAS